jgi:hypothetical protein
LNVLCLSFGCFSIFRRLISNHTAQIIFNLLPLCLQPNATDSVWYIVTLYSSWLDNYFSFRQLYGSHWILNVTNTVITCVWYTIWTQTVLYFCVAWQVFTKLQMTVWHHLKCNYFSPQPTYQTIRCHNPEEPQHN